MVEGVARVGEGVARSREVGPHYQKKEHEGNPGYHHRKTKTKEMSIDK